MWRVSDGELVWDDVTNSMAAAFSPDERLLAYSDLDDGNPVILESPDGMMKTLWSILEKLPVHNPL